MPKKMTRKELMELSVEEALTAWNDDEIKISDLDFYVFLDSKEDTNEMADLFRKIYITDIEGIREALKAQKQIWEGLKKDEVYSHSFFDCHLYPLMDRFLEELEDLYFFDKLENWWAYSVLVDTSGFSLHLDYYSIYDERAEVLLRNPEDVTSPQVQSFELFKMDASLLKIEDFAAEYGVDPPAARAWIRRGKLPDAIKCGHEWRIPELCTLVGNNYEERQYYWDPNQTDLSDLPEEYGFLRGHSSVAIKRGAYDKKTYIVYFPLNVQRPFEGAKKFDIKELEKFELALISNPMIHYKRKPFAYITHRNGQGIYLDSFAKTNDDE